MGGGCNGAHIGGEEHTSRRHERVREERRKKRRGDMITKETARKKKSSWGERDGVHGVDNEEKEHGGKKRSRRTERHRDRGRRRKKRIERMLTGSPNPVLRLYPSQAEEQQSQTHFLSPWP